jgi:predicted RNA methylase
MLLQILGDHKVLAVFENSQKEQSEQNDADVGSGN